VGPRAGLDVCEKSRPHQDSIPGLSSQSLYRLSYPAHRLGVGKESKYRSQDYEKNLRALNFLITESLGLLNDPFPFLSILDADQVFNLHLTNILFDVILPSVLNLRLTYDLLVMGFHLNIFLAVLVSGILCT
jgi:hypothetical protein